MYRTERSGSPLMYGASEMMDYGSGLWFVQCAQEAYYARGRPIRWMLMIARDIQLNTGVPRKMVTLRGLGIKEGTVVFDERVDPPLRYVWSRQGLIEK